MSTFDGSLGKVPLSLFASLLLAGFCSAASADSAKVKPFEGLFSGRIVKEEVKHDEMNGEHQHVMHVQGKFSGLSGTVDGRMKLVLKGHHGHTGHDPSAIGSDHEHEPECVDAYGTGEMAFKSGVVHFSQVGSVCVNVPGVASEKTHLFHGTYYFNKGTRRMAGTFGSGNLSGSFDADPENSDPTKKRVILRFDGAIGQ